VQHDQEHSFRLGGRRVNPGLEYGVDGMRVGGQRRIVVGPHLAYREAGIPGVVPEVKRWASQCDTSAS
jgi:FKBP-type peptidyl-prolyl cis-trans isomerase